MKTKNKFLAVILAVILVLSVSAVVTACQATEETAYGMNYSYVSVSINPQADFVVDENGLVVDVIPMNEDAEILLAGIIDQFIGLTPEEAVELFTQMSVDAGYIDIETSLSNVNVEVISDEGDEAACNIAERIRAKVNQYFANNGIFGKVNIETLDKYLDAASEYAIDTEGLSLGKIKAMMTALSLMPDLDPVELSEMTVGQIIKLIHNETKDNGLKTQNSAFAQAKKELYNTKYGEITQLRAQIEEMEGQIESMEEGEEKNAMIQQMETLQAQLREMVQAYNEEVEALKEQYKQNSQEVKQHKENVRQEKVNQNKEKIQKHKENVNKNRDQIKQQVEKMQQDNQGKKDQG